MQASVRWSPPKGALGTLLDRANERVREIRHRESALVDAAMAAAKRPGFASALQSGTAVAVIAEIKRRSPSKGAIAPGLGAAAQATAYARGRAAAISVLTEPTEFGGSLDDLVAAQCVALPLLRKDFIVDRLQLLEAVVHGASAALLIARALPPTQLAELHAEGKAVGLDLLVEVHTEDELNVAVDAGYPIIGVNNRDLETLVIDNRISEQLIPQLPSHVITVYESGIKSRADVESAARTGAHAVLVGSALSASAAAEEEVRRLADVPRQLRDAR